MVKLAAPPSTTLPSLSKYEFLARIGEGNCGMIYKARHKASGALVAVKITPETLGSDPLLRKRLEQEFLTVSRLGHPGIVRGLDFGQEGMVHYLVMELLDGCSLGQRIDRQGKLPESAAVSIVADIACALHAVHQCGVIHRDIKPNNVMLTRDDKVKLTDFGIAKDVHSELTLTKPKDLLGTPAYMAPEQFDGAQNASIRSDIYSLAATLYSAVTGKIPFNGRTWLAILTRKLHHGLPSPRQVVPSLSETMERAILHGLHPDPEKRPATCLEFLAELEANTPVPLAFLEKHESALVAVRQQHLVHVERRKQLRHRVRGTARYQGKSPGKVKSIFDRAILVDVSPAGVQLCVQDGFKVGETLKVELLTPQGVPVLTREARVCWAHSAPGELYFRLGCQWIEPLTPQDLLGFA